MMAADSDGFIVTTVVTCEGDLTDPNFPPQLERVLDSLKGLLGEKLYVRKLEPWNSVRVTLSISREAALRLRQLANEGSQQLRALGILSVQVEGDQVISLRLAGPEPQEIVLRTAQQDGSGSSTSNADAGLSRIISGETQVASTPGSNEKMQFRSPNVVCPPDTVVPKVPTPAVASNSALPTTRSYSAAPFPFTSMNQAIHSRENLSTGPNYSTPPPPYPGKHPPVTLSSPLLVNLLQNDGGNSSKPIKTEPETIIVASCNGPLVQTNGAAIHSPTVKYTSSTTSFSQSTPSVKVTTPRTPTFLPKTLPTPPARTSVLTPSTAQTTLHPASLANISQPSVNVQHSVVSLTTTQASSLPHPSATQNSSLVSVGGSLQQKQLMHNSTNLHPAALITNSTTSQTSVALPNNPSLKPNSLISNIIIPKSNTIVSNSPSEAASPTVISNPIKPTPFISGPLVPNSIAHSNLHPPPTNVGISQPPIPLGNSNVPVRTATPYRSRPPPYPSHQFEPIAQPMPQLLELTPSLTELKETDLDHLLPTIERELARSPPDLPEELTRTTDNRNFLINPLTGELEPQSSSESEAEEPSDVFTGLPSPVATSDEDTNSTNRPDTTDQSDSESRSTHSDSSKNSRQKNARNRERGRDSPNLKPTEKIKLRLKLEKSEPVSPAYKVDVSFINTQPKKASSAVSGEELRVPPLHISLRGRNHVVINNKKKVKLNADCSLLKPKIRKIQDQSKLKKSGIPKEPSVNCEQSTVTKSVSDTVNTLVTIDHAKSSASEPRKVKKTKSGHEHREQNLLTGGHMMGKEQELDKHLYNSHFKERRGSDSELAHSAKKYSDSNGLLLGDKKRRLSHTDHRDLESPLPILGSTNTGTIAGLPSQKPRKDKIKLKDSSKAKELNRNKSYAKNLVDKLAKQVILPTGEIDMEAKFKQRLLEDTEKGVSRPPHRTESVQKVEKVSPMEQAEKVAELVQTLSDPPPLKDKPPEHNKCNTPDRKPELSEKQAGRSPNSGGQGEDSGIESMDALSEKSPNQASQSPHADISDTMKSKTQVPDMLDIEAQLAKMEGLNGEDLNENKHNTNVKLEQCCGLTSALQDSLKQGTVSLTMHSSPVLKEQLPQVEVSLVPLKTGHSEEDLEPLPVHVAPPLYTYSNPDKGRGSESPTLSDSDSNSCPIILKSKSLLEQLLIEIPDNQAPSSPSPATRSLRTRASSKLNSPELNSPVPPKQAKGTPAPKRKRHESDSSNNSLEDMRNKKPRKCSENAAELIKACMGVEPSKTNIKKNKLTEESSDSDEPLIEVAGKVRKNNNMNSTTPRTKLKPTPTVGVVKTAAVNTRRSVRTTPALNTRSKGDKAQPDADVLRRKTRSSVSEGEGKRRKDVK